MARITKEESEDYFHSRPRGSQIGAWASAQSEPLATRQELEERYGEEYAVLLRLMSRLRKQLCNDAWSTYTDRKILFQNILHEDIIHWIRGGQWEQVSQHLKTVLGPKTQVDFLELIEKEIKSP